MRVTLIGSGNVATVLGRAIRQAGHQIVQVFGRNQAAVNGLALELDAKGIAEPVDMSDDAELFLIAVSDDAIPEIVESLHVQNRLLVHTAGSVSREVLKNASKNYGVLYPLQSLRKEMTVLPVIPLLVDGNTAEDITLLADFAGSISPQVRQANDSERMHYHLAAVFANNFTNHLYVMAEAYCKMTGADFRMLLPLMEQLPGRLNEYAAADLQTGPAKRGDVKTIEKHLQMLEQMPVMREFYELFTRSITKGLR